MSLASLPCKMGGLGITSTILKHRFLFDLSRNSIDEHVKTIEAPVESEEKRKANKNSGSQGARTSMKKMMKSEHEKVAAELSGNPRFGNIMKRSQESNYHLFSTSNYVNPYLFKQTLTMRLAIRLENAPETVSCPGCGTIESPSNIIPHVAGCSRCAGMNSTRKHSHIVRYLSNLCAKAGLPCAIEPRLYSSFFCTKCKCSISPEAAERHPCRARRIRSGPDLAIMWPDVGEVLYDVTVIHTCCSGYRKQSSRALLQSAVERKHRKYIVEKGLEPEYFRCIAVTDCGLMHEETKNLIKTLAKRAELDFQNTRDSFQLEIEKFAAYTVVSQLRQYISAEQWLGGLSH